MIEALKLLRTAVLAVLAVGAQRKMAEFDMLMARLDEVEAKLDELTYSVKRVLGHSLGDAKRDKAMAQSIDELRSAVAQQNDATQSAVTLIEGLAEQLQQALGDDEEVERIANELRTSAQNLAQAVTENTPFTPSGQTPAAGSQKP